MMDFGGQPGALPPLWTGGPDPSGIYSFPQVNRNKKLEPTFSVENPNTRYHMPVTTGTSVFGIKYKDGVVMAADTLGSYGSLARYPDLERIIRVNENTIVACSGDYADFQFLREIIEQKQIDEEISGGGITMRPEALHCWITRFLYNRRSKINPLWTTVLVGGLQADGSSFLGYCNYLGTAFKENAIATGLGADLAVPLLRDVLQKKNHSELSLEEATEVIKKCVRVCYLRDCRASQKYNLAVINKDGSRVEKPVTIDSNWEIAKSVAGYE